MFINPFVAGVLTTIFAELVVFFGLCFISHLKNK